MATKDELGKHGEQVAVDYLLAHDMQILDRNWRCPDGEIDVVAREGRTLVVVEVKTRSGPHPRHRLRGGDRGEGRPTAQARGQMAG